MVEEPAEPAGQDTKAPLSRLLNEYGKHRSLFSEPRQLLLVLASERRS